MDETTIFDMGNWVTNQATGKMYEKTPTENVTLVVEH